MKLIRAVFTLGLVVAVPACFLTDTGDKLDTTPAGWAVQWQDQGTLETGLHTKAQVYSLFDAAVVRASQTYQTKYGIPAQNYIDSLKGKASRYGLNFLLIDNARFSVGGATDFPGASYATGETIQNQVRLAFYNDNGPGPQSMVPGSAPPWTVLLDRGQYYWGTEDPGAQYPALEYETFVNILGLP